MALIIKHIAFLFLPGLMDVTAHFRTDHDPPEA
jgi:hypothetical protein